MDWNQAKKELDKGEAVTHSSLMGYWKWGTHSIRGLGFIAPIIHTTVYWYNEKGVPFRVAPIEDEYFTSRKDWQLHRKESIPTQYQQLEGLQLNGSKCLHSNCPHCGGTGNRRDGLGMCIHGISCNCPKCTINVSC